MPDSTAPARPTVLIVGAGASGLMVANRLAATADVTVLEAGADAGSPNPRWLLDDLVFDPALDLDWGYSDADTGLPLPRGKVTGGSTSVNAAAALRGQPWCFDEWNLPEWTWAKIAPAFAAMETDLQFGADAHHGETGPLPITRLPFGAIDASFATWAMDEGHAWVADQNAPGALGVGHWPTNMVGNGRRWGAHAAVLPGLRGSITLRTGVRALRLVITDGVCTGVRVAGPDSPETLTADHIVLSAGAFNSPELLLRSGIGPADQLAAAGIDVVLDSPGVGTNLQDHPWSVLQVTATDATAPGQRPVNGALLRYEIEADDRLEVHLYPHQAKPYVPDADPADIIVGIGLMRATSRGSVRIAESGDLEVRLGHLGTEQDGRAWRAVIADAGRYIDVMVERGIFTAPVDPWWRSAELDAAIAENLDSYGHAVGTCRIGADDDVFAVVDESLAVRGIRNLSIIDASVIPVSPRANTMLASMAVGWRGGEILAEHLSA